MPYDTIRLCKFRWFLLLFFLYFVVAIYQNLFLYSVMVDVKTSKLKRVAQCKNNIRLSKNDHGFLNDLAKTEIISETMAKRHHYIDRQTSPRRRLDKLVDEGVLKRYMLPDRDRGMVACYTFANKKVARLFGARVPSISANRTLRHEIVTSELYFQAGRPADFRKDYSFTGDDYKTIRDVVTLNKRRRPGLLGDKKDDLLLPDAVYTGADGSLVFVEADSGQYTSSQIKTKQQAWQGTKQVWGQPTRSACRLKGSSNIDTYRF